MEQSSFLTAVKSIVAGTISGMCGKVVEYPLDTIKVRLQTQDGFGGPLDCLRQTIRDEGFLALYRGLPSPLIGAAAENTAVFLLYDQTRLRIVRRQGLHRFSLDKVALGGLAAGCGTTLVLTPVELVKCRMQLQRGAATDQYKSVFDAARQIVRNEGLPGMFRGVQVTLMREVPGNAIWFTTYEAIGRWLAPSSDPTRYTDHAGASAGVAGARSLPVCMVAGGLAGSLYWGIPYPIDTVKTYMQTAANPPATLREGFRHILARGGVRALYKGWPVTVVRAFPSNAVIFLTYEVCINAMTPKTTSYPEQH